MPRSDTDARGSSQPTGRRSGAGESDLTGLLGPGGYGRLRDTLAAEEGFDLDAYREPYLARRLRARLGSSTVPPGDYAALVARDPNERRRLMETLGVNVSAFFRDPPVWAFLEEVALPPLVDARRRAGRPLRAASLGAARGEEAFSVAMLLSELTRDAPVPFRVDAFDVDPDALRQARDGLYAPAALENVSGPGLARYFEERPDGLLVARDALRRRVRVERRDVLGDPLPDTYDLALCRNIMIYMDDRAKERLLAKIHDALAPDGLLVIGQSEVILGPAQRLYRSLSPRARVYVREG